MQSFVLDTSALMVIHKGEPGTVEVEAILRRSSNKKVRVQASFITLIEMFYIFWQREGKEVAYKNHLSLQMLPIEFVYPTEKLLLTAGEFKALHSLSLADALIAALAKESLATLIHKDPEFEGLTGIIKQKALPYKS